MNQTTTNLVVSPSKKINRPPLTNLFFFYPTSFIALILLLILSYNGASIFYLQIPISPEKEIRGTTRTWSSLSTTVMYSVKEESQISNLSTHFSILQKTEVLNTSLSRRKPKRFRFRRTKPLFKLLQAKALSKQFQNRAKKFLSRSCKLRFFMTWISSLESFGDREVLSIESVFKSHPNACLLILSNSMDTQRGNHLLTPFKQQGFRVSAISPDFNFLFKNTSAEAWFEGLKKGYIDPGEVPLGQNLSNLIRLAVLYKYGGVYLDTDIIVLKSFKHLRNVIGAQTMDLQTGNWSRLNNAVMIFDKKHPLLYKFIEDFSLTFNGNRWGHNGPYMVSRVVSRMSERPGFNLTILPPVAFYPVDWNGVRGLFHGPIDGSHSRWISAKLKHIKENSFGVHLWNKHSRELKIEKGSILSRLVLDNCVFCNFSA